MTIFFCSLVNFSSFLSRKQPSFTQYGALLAPERRTTVIMIPVIAKAAPKSNKADLKFPFSTVASIIPFKTNNPIPTTIRQMGHTTDFRRGTIAPSACAEIISRISYLDIFFSLFIYVNILI